MGKQVTKLREWKQDVKKDQPFVLNRDSSMSLGEKLRQEIQNQNQGNLSNSNTKREPNQHFQRDRQQTQSQSSLSSFSTENQEEMLNLNAYLDNLSFLQGDLRQFSSLDNNIQNLLKFVPQEQKELASQIYARIGIDCQKIQSSYQFVQQQAQQELKLMLMDVNYKYREKQIQNQVKKQKLNEKLQEYKKLKNSVKNKENDMSHEVHQLLSVIDDHKKMNTKLNKHYKKRMKLIMKELIDLQGMVQENQGFVGYNGIPLGGVSLVNNFKNNLLRVASGYSYGLENQAPLTGRQALEDKSQSIINSARLSSRKRDLSQPIQTQLRQLIDKLEDFMNVKVRHKDPLDGHNPLMSSRLTTQRTANKQLNHCISSARLDKGFIQNTSRSNLMVSARGQKWTARGKGGNQKLCDTCLSHTQYSIYSIQEENNQQEENHLDSSRIKEFLGKSPDEMTLSEKQKKLCEMLSKEKQMENAQHVQASDILNYSKSNQVFEYQQQLPVQNKIKVDDQVVGKMLLDKISELSSNEPNQNTNKSFDNSFTLGDQYLSQQNSKESNNQLSARNLQFPKQTIKVPSLNLEKVNQPQKSSKLSLLVPALNLEKITNNQKDYFMNNLPSTTKFEKSPISEISDSQTPHEDEKEQQDYSRNFENYKGNTDKKLSLPLYQAIQEKVILLSNKKDEKECFSEENTLNFNEDYKKEEANTGKNKNGNQFSFAESLMLSPIPQGTEDSKFEFSRQAFSIESKESRINQMDKHMLQELPSFKLSGQFFNTAQQKPLNTIVNQEKKNYLEHELSTNRLIKNLDDLFGNVMTNENITIVNEISSNKKSSEKKIIIKRLEASNQVKAKQSQKKFFNMQGNTQVPQDNFTLGPQDGEDSNDPHTRNSSITQQPVIIRSQTRKVTGQVQQIKLPGRNSVGKSKPVIAKKINNIFNNQQEVQSRVNQNQEGLNIINSFRMNSLLLNRNKTQGQPQNSSLPKQRLPLQEISADVSSLKELVRMYKQNPLSCKNGNDISSTTLINQDEQSKTMQWKDESLPPLLKSFREDQFIETSAFGQTKIHKNTDKSGMNESIHISLDSQSNSQKCSQSDISKSLFMKRQGSTKQTRNKGGLFQVREPPQVQQSISTPRNGGQQRMNNKFLQRRAQKVQIDDSQTISMKKEQIMKFPFHTSQNQTIHKPYLDQLSFNSFGAKDTTNLCSPLNSTISPSNQVINRARLKFLKKQINLSNGDEGQRESSRRRGKKHY